MPLVWKIEKENLVIELTQSDEEGREWVESSIFIPLLPDGRINLHVEDLK